MFFSPSFSAACGLLSGPLYTQTPSTQNEKRASLFYCTRFWAQLGPLAPISDFSSGWMDAPHLHPPPGGLL